MRHKDHLHQNQKRDKNAGALNGKKAWGYKSGIKQMIREHRHELPRSFFSFGLRHLELFARELGVLLFRALVDGDLVFGSTGNSLLQALLKYNG